MATHLSLNLPSIRPYSIGFDRIFDELSRNMRMLDNRHQSFPPYDVDFLNSRHDHPCDEYIITMALAGYGNGDVDVTVADNCLTVKSSKAYEERTSAEPHGPDIEQKLYSGIAKRKFTRDFQLADDVEVASAELDNGMLYISLQRIVPEEKKPRVIEVT